MYRHLFKNSSPASDTADRRRRHRSPLARCVVAVWVALALFTATAQANLPQSEREKAELRRFLKDTIDEADSFADRFDAEVWLVDMSGRLAPFVKDPKQRLRLLKAIHREARRANLKPDLVLAVIEIESHFDRFAVSRVGAQGLMQVMPFWKNEIGRPEDNLTQIDTNLRYGCRILQFYLKKEDGDLKDALARYNGSYGRHTYSNKVMRAWKRRWYAGTL